MSRRHRPVPISKGTQLLVEGNDQRNFFQAFAKHLGIQHNFQIQDFRGISDLPGFLKSLANAPNYSAVHSIGIVRDAESDAAGALQSIQSGLRRAGMPTPDQTGTPADGLPSVKVLILPGEGKPGMLETVLRKSLVHEPVNQCIIDFSDAWPTWV